MKFTYLSYNPSKNYMWSLHAAGCADIKQELKGVRTDSGWPAEMGATFEAKDLKEALDYVVDEELREMGWDNNAVKVNPCCKKH
jgi:hypothetical protein